MSQDKIAVNLFSADRQESVAVEVTLSGGRIPRAVTYEGRTYVYDGSAYVESAVVPGTAVPG